MVPCLWISVWRRSCCEAIQAGLTELSDQVPTAKPRSASAHYLPITFSPNYLITEIANSDIRESSHCLVLVALMSKVGLILIVEDNRMLAETVGTFLENKGYEIDYASDGLEGFRLARENRYDAIVLDGNLPRMDGLDVVRGLRLEARLSTPVIMVSARDTLEDKIKGLELGVDDYLTKPFAAQELAARLQAVIRRDRKELAGEILKVGDLTLDPHSFRVNRAGRNLELSPLAMKLLQILMRESPRVVSRRELEREIWGDSLPDSDTLRSHLYNVRKIVDKGFDEPLLHTVTNVGYRLSTLPAESASASNS